MPYSAGVTAQPQMAPGRGHPDTTGQPQTTNTDATTVIITTQPSPAPVLTPSKRWDWHLFDVPDCGLFVMSWFCPCLVFGSTAQAIGHSYVLCCTFYLFTLMCPFFLPVHILLGCFFRERVRQRYRIRGNLCCDLLAYVLCCPCTLNQEALQADTEQRVQVNGAQGRNGVSIRLGPRVINLRSDRATAQSTGVGSTVTSGAQVPLLGPTVACAPVEQQIVSTSIQPAPVIQSMPSVPPYPTDQQSPIGFGIPATAPACT
ncbi:hypothetical protein FBUS_05051 [Fasciolopsis buskii]|uniref:PLAC8 family protein n=1 Tax=Fasciolopsis buskii TaxID=27845 RepID=A0A8E0S3T7_9TREM|nr:hypothetical protein FBUS_05051 [Fasciolopsis buski]